MHACMKDLELGMISGIAKFADDTKLFRVVKIRDYRVPKRSLLIREMGAKMADVIQWEQV